MQSSLPESAENKLRSLNILIAERIFGVNPVAFAIYDRRGNRLRERDFDSIEEAQKYIDDTDDRQLPANKFTGKIEQCVRDVPHYSTDPVASKQLREKLAEKFTETVMTRMAPEDRPRNQEPFEFVVGFSDRTAFYAEGETEELAVALCAKKVIDAGLFDKPDGKERV